MIHIAPWECCKGLLRGAGRYVRSGGVLVMYGPFRIGGAHTAENLGAAALDTKLLLSALSTPDEPELALRGPQLSPARE